MINNKKSKATELKENVGSWRIEKDFMQKKKDTPYLRCLKVGSERIELADNRKSVKKWAALAGHFRIFLIIG